MSKFGNTVGGLALNRMVFSIERKSAKHLIA